MRGGGGNQRWDRTFYVMGVIYEPVSQNACKATMVFLCFRWARALDLGRALPKKNICFFCPARALDCCRFAEKNNQFREIKKNILKKQVRSKLFYFVALITFSRNLSNVFFTWSPSLTFPKICSMFFFQIFFLLSLIRFWIFFDLKQRN